MAMRNKSPVRCPGLVRSFVVGYQTRLVTLCKLTLANGDGIVEVPGLWRAGDIFLL